MQLYIRLKAYNFSICSNQSRKSKMCKQRIEKSQVRSADGPKYDNQNKFITSLPVLDLTIISAVISLETTFCGARYLHGSGLN